VEDRGVMAAFMQALALAPRTAVGKSIKKKRPRFNRVRFAGN
jgi:hypothetical protein